MKLKLNKTLKIGAALLASVGVSGLTALAVVSCSSTTPLPTRDQYENWTWEAFARNEYGGIKPSIPGISLEDVKKAGWNTKSEILLADWERDFPDAEYIERDAFNYVNCPDLETIEIPDTIRCIGQSAFESSDTAPNHLSGSIRMSNEIVVYMAYAFKNVKIEVPLSTTTIGVGPEAFVNTKFYSNTPNKKILILPETAYDIYDSAFATMTELSEVQFDFSKAKNLEILGYRTFYPVDGDKVQLPISGKIDLPPKLKAFDFRTFSGSKITNISFHRDTQEIIFEGMNDKWLKTMCPEITDVDITESCRAQFEANKDFFTGVRVWIGNNVIN